MLTDGPAGVDDDIESDAGNFAGDVGNELFGELRNKKYDFFIM